MIIDNPEQNLPKYKYVHTIRQLDGRRLMATQVDQNELLPPRWDYEESKNASNLSDVTAFRAIICEIKESLTTDELIKKGQVEEYGAWQTNEEQVANS